MQLTSKILSCKRCKTVLSWWRGRKSGLRWFGQPAAQTHPHLLQHGEVTPGITLEEYKLRRFRLMEMVARSPSSKKSDHHLVIVPAATKSYMTHDIPYPFRQNTNLLYLCGFQEPDGVLILQTKKGKLLPEHVSTLFVPKKDPNKELWEGSRSGKEGSVELTGVDTAHNLDHMSEFLSQCLRDKPDLVVWYDLQKPPHADFHRRHMVEFLRESKVKAADNLTVLIQALRAFKSEAEILLMERTCQIASEAFKEVMQFSHSGVSEAHLYAKMDFECRIRGAEYLAYPPVVAGGNRANTIHYISNNQLIAGGELVLMDAGCEYHGYSSDITRTWPVSGEFTRAQRDLYEAVLEVQQECVKIAGSGAASLERIFHEMLRLIGLQLQRLGFIAKHHKGTALQMLARDFCPHHVGHYLGMDVHDTDRVSRNIKLQPGIVITIEPGIYIPETKRDVPAEFRGNGIRIEDDILITSSGCKNLTESCPKHPDDILAILRESKS